jgi:hypothetical protein
MRDEPMFLNPNVAVIKSSWPLSPVVKMAG